VNSGGISVTGNVDLSGDITKSGQKLLRTGGDSLGVGTNALSSIGGGGHTAVGIGALNSVTTAYHNTAVGTGALNAVTSGSANTAIGHAALQNTTTGTYNVAVGESAMQNTTTGSYNVALGRDSLSKATVAAFNTVVGMYAGASLLDGCCNTAVGANALYSGTKGQWNVALGNGALSQLLGGNWNTAVGFTAGSYLTAGDGNTMIGLNAGFYNTGGSYNLYLGSSGDPAAPAESNTIRIGEPFVLQQHHRAFIAAVRGRTTGAADAVPVVIDSKGQLGTASSSRRTKTAIRDMGDTTAAVMSLRPVRFQYKAHGPESPEQYGLVAEEVAEVAPDLVARGQDGEVETVFYDKVNAMLLNEVQKQHRLNEAQDRLIQSQRQELSGLLRRLAELEGLMQASKSGREE
jgi:hypothetical protein